MKTTAPSLFDPPMARTTDPDTSHIAAQKMKDTGAMNKQSKWVLDSLKAANGSTYRELAAAMGLHNPNACARRLPDLRNKGLVVNGENRVCKVAGNKMQTWWLTSTFGPQPMIG